MKKELRVFLIVFGVLLFLIGLTSPIFARTNTSFQKNEQDCEIQVGERSPFFSQEHFTSAYARHGFEKMGCASNSVHQWNDILVQDFSGGEYGNSAILYRHGEDRAYVLGSGILDEFWDNYLHLWRLPIADMASAIPSEYGTEGYSARFPGQMSVYTSQLGTFVIRGATNAKFDLMGGTGSVLGFPISEGKRVTSSTGSEGWYQEFEKGRLYTITRYDRRVSLAIYGKLLEEYVKQDAHNGILGFPIGDSITTNNIVLSDVKIFGEVKDEEGNIVGPRLKDFVQHFQHFENGQLYRNDNDDYDYMSDDEFHMYAGEMVHSGHQAPCGYGQVAGLTTLHSIKAHRDVQANRRAYDWICAEINENGDLSVLSEAQVYAPHSGAVFVDTVQYINPEKGIFVYGVLGIDDLDNDACTIMFHLRFDEELKSNHGEFVEAGQPLAHYYNVVGSGHVHVASMLGTCSQHWEQYGSIYGGYSHDKETAIIYNEIGFAPSQFTSETGDGKVYYDSPRLWVIAGYSACLSSITTFCDVPDYHPFYPFIEAIAEERSDNNIPITNGCKTTSYLIDGNEVLVRRYCPDDKVSNGQGYAFITRALGIDTSTLYNDGLQIYEDVPIEHTFYADARYLNEIGILPDLDGGYLGIDEEISRVYFTHLAAEALREIGYPCHNSTEQIFADVDSNHEYFEDVQCLASRSRPIITGFTEYDKLGRPYFKPNLSLPRGAAAKILDGLVTIIERLNPR